MEGCNEQDGNVEVKKRREKSDDWRDEWGIDVHNICFLAFLLQVNALGHPSNQAFAFCLTLQPALNFSPRSCSFFHPWAHFMKKLVNIDEGHISSHFNQGARVRDSIESREKMSPTWGLILDEMWVVFVCLTCLNLNISALKCVSILYLCVSAGSLNVWTQLFYTDSGADLFHPVWLPTCLRKITLWCDMWGKTSVIHERHTFLSFWKKGSERAFSDF